MNKKQSMKKLFNVGTRSDVVFSSISFFMAADGGFLSQHEKLSSTIYLYIPKIPT